MAANTSLHYLLSSTEEISIYTTHIEYTIKNKEKLHNINKSASSVKVY